MLVGIAYCLVFQNKDVKKAQETLAQTTEPQKKNLPDFYKTMLNKVNNEISSQQSLQKPTEEELKLIDKIE
jgi:hypothetical protein